jgi:hypothetical protein
MALVGSMMISLGMISSGYSVRTERVEKASDTYLAGWLTADAGGCTGISSVKGNVGSVK